MVAAKRLMWFVLLWAGGVATVGAVAFALRSVLTPLMRTVS